MEMGHDVVEDMLEHFFGSRTRVKLLSLLLRHPDEPMFVRELTRKIGTQINAVRRELANLAKLGLIIEAEQRPPAEGEEEAASKKHAGVKRRYYVVNPNFPLLAEVTSLVVKSQVILERQLDREIAKLGDVRYIALLGVFMGKQAPVDLFVVGTIPIYQLQALVADLERDLGCEINFSLMTPDEYKYRKDMSDKFLNAILESPKNVVIDRLNERAREG